MHFSTSFVSAAAGHPGAFAGGSGEAGDTVGDTAGGAVGDVVGGSGEGGVIHREQLPNGLWLLAESIPSARSVAMEFRLPAGSSRQPEDRQAVAPLLAEMMYRGAGDLDARAHSDALDLLGVDRGVSVGSRTITLSAVMILDRLDEAMPLLFDMVRRPTLDESELKPSRLLALQDLDALEDEPQQRVMERLINQHMPAPYGRSRYGIREHVKAATIGDVRAFREKGFVPRGAILSFAGNIDWPRLRDRVRDLLGDWSGPASAEPALGSREGETDGHRVLHEAADSAQVHIALAYGGPAEPDADSILQRAAVAVLSGGMSGRLFTEVREKRGLCYSVYAMYSGDRDWGNVFAYAGTTAPRAQETYDVLTDELRRLADGIDESEFGRAIVGMKSRLVRQGESTRARASAIAGDQFTLGSPRTLKTLAAQVDAVTLDAVRGYVAGHVPRAFTVVTIGPNPLSI